MEMDTPENLLSETPELVDYKVLSVRKRKFGEISLDDPFFDTLKEDYSPGFEAWFKKKSGDEAYVTVGDGKILSFLYLKIENEDEDYSKMEPPMPPKKRLKVGTFKVSHTGFRLGERFLKIIFDNALKNGVKGIYVTIYDKRPEQRRLISLLGQWGFNYWGKNGGENVYVRDFEPPREINISQLKKTYPYISGKQDVFIVPIRPEYHTELLPDSILRTESPEEFVDDSPHRNCIDKVYVSRARRPHPRTGDILIFYRNGGFYKGVVTTIGVVQELRHHFENEEEFISYCKKSSVFSEDGLRKAWRRYPSWKPFVVRFLYVYSFDPRINMKKLIDLKIFQGTDDAPRGFKPITKDQLKTIIRETKSDDSFIIY